MDIDRVFRIGASMRNHDAAKAARELEVFELFARLTQLPVSPSRVRQDAPDIGCELESGETVTYELVTLDSDQSSQIWGDFQMMCGAWSNAIKSLSEHRQRMFFDHYRHASITPEYGTRPSRQERPKLLRAMIARLLEQPAGFVGTSSLRSPRVIPVLPRQP
jgi:hypothetical protein